MRVREGAEIKVPAFPGIGELETWKVAVAKAVQATSGRKDFGPWLWLLKASDEKIPFEELGDVPGKYFTLDQKLSVALQASLKNGELKNRIVHMETARQHSYQKPVAGAQVVRLILESFRYTNHLHQHYQQKGIACMKWMGDQAVSGYLDEMETLLRDLR